MGKLTRQIELLFAATTVLVALTCLSTTCFCDAAKHIQSNKNNYNSNHQYRQHRLPRRALDGKTAKATDGRFYYADSGYYGSDGGAMMMLSEEGSKAAKAGGEGEAMMPAMYDEDDDDDDTAAGMMMTPTSPTWTVGEVEHILDEVEVLEEEAAAAIAAPLPPAQYHHHENYGWDESTITSKAGKGTKSAKAKSSKAKSAKGELPPWEGAEEDDDGWNYYDDAWISSEEDDEIPCGTKAGKDCPPGTLMPIPPIEWVPSAPPKPIDGAPVPSPPTDGLLTMAPTPCIGDCASLPPIQVVSPTTAPPAMASSTLPPSAVAPPTTDSSSSPPAGLIPITVSPVSEAPFPTYSPTGMPSTTIQSLTKELHPPTSTTSSSTSLDGVTTSGTWFQTGKSYDTEVTEYARSRVSGEEMQQLARTNSGSIGTLGVRDRDENNAQPLLIQDGSGHAVQEEVGGNTDNNIMPLMGDSVSSSSSATSSGGSILLPRMVLLCGGGLVAIAYSLL